MRRLAKKAIIHPLAAVYREAIDSSGDMAPLVSHQVGQVRLDDFCATQGLTRIDFLKIDTEGHELAVLRGAAEMMNVVSRVFMKDFYALLKDYLLYRLDTHRLIPLAAYSAFDEIFKFQNIFAVHQESKA